MTATKPQVSEADRLEKTIEEMAEITDSLSPSNEPEEDRANQGTDEKIKAIADELTEQQILEVYARKKGLSPGFMVETEFVSKNQAEITSPPELPIPTPETTVKPKASMPAGTGFGPQKQIVERSPRKPAVRLPEVVKTVDVELNGQTQTVAFQPIPGMGSTFIRLLAALRAAGFQKEEIKQQLEAAWKDEGDRSAAANERFAQFVELLEGDVCPHIEACLACYPELSPIAETVPAYRVLDRLNLLAPLFQIVASGFGGNLN